MKLKCAICGEKLGKLNTSKLSDGCICLNCCRISFLSTLASVNEVKNAWLERCDILNP